MYKFLTDAQGPHISLMDSKWTGFRALDSTGLFSHQRASQGEIRLELRRGPDAIEPQLASDHDAVHWYFENAAKLGEYALGTLPNMSPFWQFGASPDARLAALKEVLSAPCVIVQRFGQHPVPLVTFRFGSLTKEHRCELRFVGLLFDGGWVASEGSNWEVN